MGYSNIQVALVRKYRTWLSEKRVLDLQIAKIEEAARTLEEKRSRTARVQLLLTAVETIMSEVNPDWDRNEEKPAQQHTTSLPFEAGEITRWTLDAMREAPSNLRVRDIGDQLMKRKSLDLEDKELVDRVRKSIDGNLHSLKRRNHVGKTDEWPARWYIIGRNSDEPV